MEKDKALITASLPPHCDRPLLLGQPPRGQNAPAGAALSCLREVLHRLEHQQTHAPTLMGLWSRASGALHRLSRDLLLAAPRVEFRQDPEGQRDVLDHTKENESPTVLEAYRVYDQHFRVQRLEKMTWLELAAQSCQTLSLVCGDLGHVLLARESHRALAAAQVDMLERLFPEAQAAAEPEELHHRGALDFLDRWVNGHHLFALCCYFGRELLAQACEACQANDSQAAASSVTAATVHLQASSCAMAYTSDLPSAVYLDKIRPAMPAGFSGSHNSDFNHFKLLKGRLQKVLMQKWGQHPDGWPADVRQAADVFRAIDKLDIDQHVLIAAAHVGLARSLKQASSGSAVNAIEGLRHLLETRSHDFHLDCCQH